MRNIFYILAAIIPMNLYAMPFIAPQFNLQTRQYKANVISNGGAISYSSLHSVDSYLVKGMLSNGLWGKTTRLNPVAGSNIASSVTLLISIVGSAYDSAVSMTNSDYAELTGWTTDGSSKYINTGYTPSEATGGMSAYLRTAQPNSATTQYAIMGALNNTFTQVYRISANLSSAGLVTSANVQGVWGASGSTNGCGTSSGGMASGLWNITRSSSTVLNMYRNGSQIATTSTSTTPGSAGAALTIMARNLQATGAQTYLNSGSSVAGYGIDSGLSASQANSLYWAWQSFQSAMGRNI